MVIAPLGHVMGELLTKLEYSLRWALGILLFAVTFM
jgi:hypothetical protein